MRVTQDDRVDGVDLEREWQAIALWRIASALDHAAIQQQLPAGNAQNVAGAGNLARRPEELQLHLLSCSVPVRNMPAGSS
jgi:hypothetical protein